MKPSRSRIDASSTNTSWLSDLATDFQSADAATGAAAVVLAGALVAGEPPVVAQPATVRAETSTAPAAHGPKSLFMNSLPVTGTSPMTGAHPSGAPRRGPEGNRDCRTERDVS